MRRSKKGSPSSGGGKQTTLSSLWIGSVKKKTSKSPNSAAKSSASCSPSSSTKLSQKQASSLESPETSPNRTKKTATGNSSSSAFPAVVDPALSFQSLNPPPSAAKLQTSKTLAVKSENDLKVTSPAAKSTAEQLFPVRTSRVPLQYVGNEKRIRPADNYDSGVDDETTMVPPKKTRRHAVQHNSSEPAAKLPIQIPSPSLSTVVPEPKEDVVDLDSVGKSIPPAAKRAADESPCSNATCSSPQSNTKISRRVLTPISKCAELASLKNSSTKATTALKTQYSKPLVKKERCAVLIKASKGERDDFGRLKTNFWQPADVIGVSKIKSKDPAIALKVKVEFGPKKVGTFNWTADSTSRIQRLILGKDGSEHLELIPSICRTPAPAELKIGDGVLGWFQKGQGYLTGEYFQGRVAFVDGELCSIAYDDGDWEEEIPYKSTEPFAAVIRYSDGWQKPEWMIGLTVNCPSRKRHGKTAKIVSADPGGSVWLKYRDHESMEKQPYLKIVQYIMTEARDKAKRKWKWPTGSPSVTDSIDNSLDTTQNTGNSPQKESADVDGLDISFDTDMTSPIQGEDLNDSLDSSYRTSLESAPSEEECVDAPPKLSTHRKRSAAAAARAEMSPSPASDSATVNEESNKKQRTTRRPTRKSAQVACRKIEECFDDSASSEILDEPSLRKSKTRRRAATTAEKSKASSGNGSHVEDGEDLSPVLSQRHSSRRTKVDFEQNKKNSIEASRKVPTTLVRTELNSEAAKGTSKKAPSRKRRCTTQDSTAAKKSSTRQRKSKTASDACIAESDTEDNFEGCWHETSDPDTQQSNLSKPVIPFSLASSIRREWEACASRYAADAMGHLQFHHGLAPEESLRIATEKLILKGPQSGSTSFPDCLRMDMANEVVRPSLLNISWTQLWNEMMSPLYTVEKDDRRLTNFAVERIAASAHAKSIAAGNFLEAAKSEYPCAAKSWRDDIGKRGPREAFRIAVDTYLSLWASYGHFYVGTEWEIEQTSPDDRVSVQRNVRQLLQNLGKIVSFAGQVYWVENCESDVSLADFLYQRIESKMQDYSLVEELRGDTDLEQLKDRMKLRMTLDLDYKVLPNVRPLLAAKLGFAEKYNAIF